MSAISGTSPTIMISATTPSTTGRPVFHLEFCPEPGCEHPIKALRALLKLAKRQFKLKCVSAHENTEEQP